jgi:very-short-patch-repair endonuclease
MTQKEFLKKAIGLHGNKYEYLNLGDIINVNDTIKIMYKGEKFNQKVVKHLMGRCPEKGLKMKTTEQFIEEAKSIWGHKYDYKLTKYKGSLKKVKIIYEDIVFEQRASSHLAGLCVEKNMNEKYFIQKSIEKWGNKYDYSLVNYKNSKKKVKIIYENVIYEQTPDNHIRFAPEKISNKRDTSSFIKEAKLIHGNKYDYGKVKYFDNKYKIIITCPNHGDFKQTPNSHLMGNGCPKCSSSKGETKIENYLNEKKIEYIKEYKFEDCKNIEKLKFDFYLPRLNICIEYDGVQHFKPIKIFGGEKYFNYLKKNDNIKNKYCKSKNINIIRIDYTQYDNIDILLDSEFGKILIDF